jgi:hypothetical protein
MEIIYKNYLPNVLLPDDLQPVYLSTCANPPIDLDVFNLYPSPFSSPPPFILRFLDLDDFRLDDFRLDDFLDLEDLRLGDFRLGDFLTDLEPLLLLLVTE